MADTSVELRDLAKYHGATLAVDHLSLEVRSGEFFSILGPSGAGKTTTLRLVAGFERPDQGEILIEGRSMRHVPPNLRPVNLVFQTYALFPHMTVFDNVAFGLEMRRVSRSELRSRVSAALDMVRLSDKHDRHPSQLSGGEQQRVALARALVNRPAVVLLDEPLGALDQQLRQEMQVELKAIQKQVGITFICVTHHQEEALIMSDRVAVMDHGRVLQVGSPQEVYESPTTEFVARFIGLSNHLKGRIATLHDTTCTITAPDIPAAGSILIRRPPGAMEATRVMLLLRPERLHVSHNVHPGRFHNAVSARVDKVTYTGNEMQYLVRLSDSVLWKARLPNSGASQDRFRVGETVLLCWNADDGVILTE